jgi:hypothetical protein
MSFTCNRVTLNDRAAAASEVRFAPGGQRVASCSIAADRPTRTGAPPTTDWHRVVCWASSPRLPTNIRPSAPAFAPRHSTPTPRPRPDAWKSSPRRVPWAADRDATCVAATRAWVDRERRVHLAQQRQLLPMDFSSLDTLRRYAIEHEFAAAVSAGQTLPGFETFTEDDQRSWESFATRLADSKSSWDWRLRDNRREAALGLATRCDAGELYESLRLGDPLVATRESFSGTAVSGVVTAVPARTRIEVTLDYLACRLRENAAIEGSPGYPRDVPAANGRGPWLHGRVASTRVTTDERLVVTITDAVVRPGPARIGQRVTLRPRSVDPGQQRSGRHELHRRYTARRSWLSGGSPPAPRRRDVPLDVVVAAAE